MIPLEQKVGNEAGKFIFVGGIGFMIDVGIFNILSMLGESWGVFGWPIISKTAGTVIASLFTYVTNGRWTFKERQGRPEGFRRIGLYLFVGAIGWIITIGALFVSRYVLGLDSLLADNIAANVIGVALATLFRFWASRKWVFVW